MIEPNAVVYSMSALSLTVATALVFYAIYFMVLFGIFWTIALGFNAIKKIFDFNIK